MEIKDSIQIAYAEEQALVRKGIISLLTTLDNLDFTIEANDGTELLNRLTEASTLPDLCILGVKMSPLDGHSTLVELKKRWPGLRVMVLTDNTNPQIMMRMIAAGANGYVQKKNKPEMILRAIHDIHDNEYHYSNQATSRIFKQIREHTIKTPSFSQVELEFMKYAGTNLSYEAIGKKLGVTGKSVEGYRMRIFQKLGISNRAELALFAFQSGLITNSDTK